MPNTEYQEQKHAGPVHYEDEITLKELILNIVDFSKEIFRKWWLFPIFWFLSAAYHYDEYVNHIPLYNATVTFMLDEDAAGGGTMGGLNELLGGLGGSNSSGLLKIVQLFKSRVVIDNSVLERTTINGKNDILANHLLNVYPGKDLIRDFNGNLLTNFKDVDNFKFENGATDSLNHEERIMLKVIYYTIVGHKDIKNNPPLIRTNLDEDSGIMKMSAVSKDEELTLSLGDVIYKNLSAFFINKAVEKQKKLYDIIQFKKDSVGAALQLAEYKLADYENRNRSMTNYKGFLEKMKLQREKTILSVMYSSIVKNMEAADFALRSKTPYVQVIDVPFRPLSPSRVSFGLTFIKVIAIGTLIALLLIIFRKIIVDALAT